MSTQDALVIGAALAWSALVLLLALGFGRRE